MRLIWVLFLLFSTSFQDEVSGSNSKLAVSINIEDAPVTKKSFEEIKVSRDDLHPSNETPTPPEKKPSAGMEFANEFADEESTEPGNELYIAGLKLLNLAGVNGEEAKQKAYELFARAVKLGHKDSIKHIAYAHLFGDRTAWSPKEAYTIFKELARQGSADAQFAFGFMHATGIGMKKSNPAKALLYYTFAANGGSPLAQMAMGYRYFNGIGIAPNCSMAAYYYSQAGRRVGLNMNGIYPLSHIIRLPDESEPTVAVKPLPYMDKTTLDFYRMMSRQGDRDDWVYQEKVGFIYLTGALGAPRDSAAALEFYTNAAADNKPEALARLGQMYLIGTPATPVNHSKAFDYFLRSVENAKKGQHSGLAYLGLSMMYFYGYDVEVDHQKAFDLLSLVIDKRGEETLSFKRVKGEAHLLMAEFQSKAGDPKTRVQMEIKHYQNAIQNLNYLAAYNLGFIHERGHGVPKNCRTAVGFYKIVAEEGLWTEKLIEAYNAFWYGSKNEAAIKYALMAEIGYEKAQTNFAYMLEKGHARDVIDESRANEVAFTFWLRAARQNYALARNKVGDYYYYGWGVSTDYVKAFTQYQVAAEDLLSSQAMFNLGYMHERGLGLPKDLHLAKRYYDLAEEESADARFPVLLARFKLSILFMVESLNEWPLVKFLDRVTNGTWDLILMTLLLAAIIGILIRLRYLHG